MRSLVIDFENAFNSHDLKTLVNLLVEDAEWTDITGTTTMGKMKLSNQHVYPFQTVLKEATLDIKSFRNKWIDDNDRVNRN